MNSLILTVRALTAEFVKRLAVPIVIIALSILILVNGLVIWLTTTSGWWGILLFFTIMALFVFITITIAVGIILHALNPSQTSTQKKMVRKFVDKLQEIADTVQTPKVFIVGRLVMDVIRKNNNGMVQTMSSHTLTTKKDFDELRNSFN